MTESFLKRQQVFHDVKEKFYLSQSLFDVRNIGRYTQLSTPNSIFARFQSLCCLIQVALLCSRSISL